MIYRCLKLTYLDGRPIHVRDRACIDAWKEVSEVLLKMCNDQTLFFREVLKQRELPRKS